MEGFKSTQWDTIKDSIIPQWSKLNDGDVKQINGHIDKLVTAVKDKYSLSQEDAEKQVKDFIDQKKSTVKQDTAKQETAKQPAAKQETAKRDTAQQPAAK